MLNIDYYTLVRVSLVSVLLSSSVVILVKMLKSNTFSFAIYGGLHKRDLTAIRYKAGNVV